MTPEKSKRWSALWLLLLVGGCGAAAATTSNPGGGGALAAYATKPTQAGRINPAAVPLGDGYRSTRPRAGYVNSCMTHFGGIGGARVNGPWINTSRHTWDYRTKLHVNGAVKWPAAFYRLAVRAGRRAITFNDLPINHVTGVFPIQSSDPAYNYDQNGNQIAAHSLNWSLPVNPAAAKAPRCTGGGPIGVLSDGALLYNALDGEGRDAGAREVLDVCAGHPDPSNSYHHHDIPPCILNKVRNGTTKLVGFAIDGYGIYVSKDRNGQLPNNTQLDACHGTASRVMWNGKLRRIYHYVATLEYPYTIGCYHGTPIAVGLRPAGPPSGGPQP